MITKIKVSMEELCRGRLGEDLAGLPMDGKLKCVMHPIQGLGEVFVGLPIDGIMLLVMDLVEDSKPPEQFFALGRRGNNSGRILGDDSSACLSTGSVESGSFDANSGK